MLLGRADGAMFVSSVASPAAAAASSSPVVSEGAAGKRNRFQEGREREEGGRKKIDKLAGEARRPLFIVQSK